MLDDAPVVGEAQQVHLLHVERLVRAREPKRVTGVDGAYARVRGCEVALDDRLDQPVPDVGERRVQEVAQIKGRSQAGGVSGGLAWLT